MVANRIPPPPPPPPPPRHSPLAPPPGPYYASDYRRDVNGDIIRLDLPYTPLRSPEQIRHATNVKDEQDASRLIKTIVDEIINKTDKLPALIFPHRTHNVSKRAMTMVSSYFETTPYKLVKDLGGWFVDFRESCVRDIDAPPGGIVYFDPDGRAKVSKRRKTVRWSSDDYAFAFACVAVLIAIIVMAVRA